MIDFQNSELTCEVFELIAKTSELMKKDTIEEGFPKFKTRKTFNDRWECEFNIPGMKKPGFGEADSEVCEINRCAENTLYLLRKNHDKGQYDPDIEESVFRDNIEEFFGDVDYNHDYQYRLVCSDILLSNNDVILVDLLKQKAKKTIQKIKDSGEEVDRMCDIVSLRFLIKKKKQNRC